MSNLNNISMVRQAYGGHAFYHLCVSNNVHLVVKIPKLENDYSFIDLEVLCGITSSSIPTWLSTPDVIPLWFTVPLNEAQVKQLIRGEEESNNQEQIAAVMIHILNYVSKTWATLSYLTTKFKFETLDKPVHGYNVAKRNGDDDFTRRLYDLTTCVGLGDLSDDQQSFIVHGVPVYPRKNPEDFITWYKSLRANYTTVDAYDFISSWQSKHKGRWSTNLSQLVDSVLACEQ